MAIRFGLTELTPIHYPLPSIPAKPLLCMLTLAGFSFFGTPPLVRYDKQPLTYEQQADQLLERGLEADRDSLVERLRSVGYYRLSGYWHPFRTSDDRFEPGVTLEKIWRRYTFDRRLRLLFLDGIERVEIALRTEIVYRHSHAHGPFGYADAANLPGIDPGKHARLLDDLRREYGRSKEAFATHFRSKYGDGHELPPIWIATELTSFGTLLTMFLGLPASMKKDIAKRFEIADRVLESWFRSLNVTRNICAHHARLWNREMYRPMIPRKDRRWHEPVAIPDHRVFVMLSILKVFLDEIAPQSRWPDRFRELLADYPEIPILVMGMPEDWEDSPIWRKGAPNP